MEKYDKKFGVIYFLLITTFIFGSSYLMNILRIQNKLENKEMSTYILELIMPLGFGMILSLPDLFVEIKKNGKWFFNYRCFLIFLLPSVILGSFEVQLINGSLFSIRLPLIFY